MDANLDFQQLMRLLPWRSRVRLKLRWVAGSVARRIHGYGPISTLLWKAKRGGWRSALCDPVFNIAKQDFETYDKQLRWHQWGVLAERGGFRGYTPTSRTADTFPSTAEAWAALKAAYWGRPNEVAWEPLRSPNDASPESLSVSQETK